MPTLMKMNKILLLFVSFWYIFTEVLVYLQNYLRMKRSILIAVTLIFALSAYGQYKQDVIASAGGYNTAAGISISWTLGETIVPTYQDHPTSPTIILTHGFQQQVIITSVEENLEEDVTVTVYPNPASDIVNIKFEQALDEEVKVLFVNSQGKPVRSIIIEATVVEQQINLQDLPAGIYYLKLMKGKLSNVYKVVKL
jgi:hypothetical protein